MYFTPLANVLLGLITPPAVGEASIRGEYIKFVPFLFFFYFFSSVSEDGAALMGDTAGHKPREPT